MAAPAVAGGFKIEKGEDKTFELQHVVASGGTTTISNGSPTKLNGYDAAGFGSGQVIPMVTGDGAIGAASSRTIFAGLAKSLSTDTTSANGVVQVYAPVPGILYRGYSLSATATDTAAEINALMGKRIKFDLTSLVWTVDTAQADALANCVCIAGGIPQTSEILFVYSPKGTNWDTSTAITS